MLKMNLQLFAHKKGVGSSKNGRDSESKRLGAKAADGEFVLAGNILYRLNNLLNKAPWFRVLFLSNMHIKIIL